MLHVHDGPLDGAHRLTLVGHAPASAWAQAAQRLATDLDDAWLKATGARPACLRQVGWEPTVEGARFYLLGAATAWVMPARAGLEIPALTHLERLLAGGGGCLDRADLESRDAGPCPYERVTAGNWPWRIEGTLQGRRVRVLGAVSPAQRAGLVPFLEAGLRAWVWSIGQQPPADLRVCLDCDALVLPLGMPRTWLLEWLWSWWQAWWVELDAVELA